jgi:hypothetical protein
MKRTLFDLLPDFDQLEKLHCPTETKHAQHNCIIR